MPSNREHEACKSDVRASQMRMDNYTGKFTIVLVDDQELVRAALALLIQSSAEMELVATAGTLTKRFATPRCCGRG